MKAIDLFAGAGGTSLGLKWAGFQILFANEINRDAAETYILNHPEVPLTLGDISMINPESIQKKFQLYDLDVLSGCPPCQGFSLAGRRQIDDPRNGLFYHMIRFVKVLRPKMFVMENVKGLASIGNGKILESMLSNFSSLNYHVDSKVLTSSDYGVPQNRQRIFIIGSSRDIETCELFNIKKKMEKVTVRAAISDLAFLDAGESATEYEISPYTKYQAKMRKNSKHLFNHESPRHSSEIQKRFSLIPTGKNHESSGMDVTNKHTCYKFNPDDVSRTITTLPEDFVHYDKNRIPTVRELARLQSFPDDFVFLGPRTTGGLSRKCSCPQYTQVGNAVPPLMAKEVFKNISRILQKYF